MNHPNAGEELRPTEWSSNLFACFEDLSNCCVTCFCPCITFGQIAEIVDEGSTPCGLGGGIYALLCFATGHACCYSCSYRKRIRSKFNLEETCGADCLVDFKGFGCCYSCCNRKKMRAKFNLSENCTDCLVHCCCELCALCQEYRELKSRGYDPALGWSGNRQKQQRKMGTAMTPPVNPNMAR